MLVTQGGRFCGYGLYILKGKPVFTWNLLDLKRVRWEGAEALSPGKHTVTFDFKSDGPGLGKGGLGLLLVDGKQVASQQMEHTVPLTLQWDETFDVGVDTGTPVDDKDYQVPFAFTGKLNKVTVSLKPSQLSAEDQRKLDINSQRDNAASE
jgi:arylsulfatase